MAERNYLFSQESLDDELRKRHHLVQGGIDAIPQEQFLISPDDDLVAHAKAALHIDRVVLHEDARSMSQQETQVDVSGDPNRFFSGERRSAFYIAGTRVEISVPFTGPAWVFKYRTNPFSSVFAQGLIEEPHGKPQGQGHGLLKLVIQRANDVDPQEFKQAYEHEIRIIRQSVERANKQIDGYQQQLEGLIRSAIADRRRRLERHSGIAALLEIPVEEKPGSPSIKPIEVQVRPLPKLPVPPKSGLKAEPGISSEVYEKILSMIRHEGRTFETTPTTFAKFAEEELRDVLLAHLNGHFQGRAGGEVFRLLGKTDIRIEEENRSAFVGECKVWGGAAQVKGDLDQLLGYLTWRDSKAAFIVFNKSVKGFAALQDSLFEAVKAHSCFIKVLPTNESGEWRVLMRSLEDEGRLVTVHVFAFNITAPKRN